VPTVLLYGDSNTFGVPPLKDPAWDRLPPAQRWSGVAHAALGADWTLIGEGLPGRTTLRDDPIEGPHKNGRAVLPAILESHWPLDGFVLMLGTNDLKARFGATPTDIAASCDLLLTDAVATLTGIGGPAPKLMLICPPPILLAGFAGDMFAGGVEKSKALPPLYEAVARKHGAAFLDAGKVIASSPIDGIHFDVGEHAKLGKAVAETLKKLFA
jgi:lysophospholipase L1-like esterase